MAEGKPQRSSATPCPLRRLLLLLLMISAVGELYGQEATRGLLIGPAAGVDYSMLNGSLPVFAGSPDCGLFASSTTIPFWFGACITLEGLLSEPLGIDATISRHSVSTIFFNQPLDSLVVHDISNGNDGIARVDHRYRLDYQRTDLRLDIDLCLTLGEGWSLLAGPWIAIATAASTEQREELLGGTPLRFTGGSLTRTMSEGTPLSKQSLLAGGRAGIKWRGKLSQRVWIVPSITLGTSFTSPIPETSWRDISIGGGIAILYNTRSTEDPLKNDPPVVDPLQTTDTGTSVAPRNPPRAIEAAVTMYGIDPRGEHRDRATIFLYETQRSNLFDLPTKLHFAFGSSELPEPYHSTGATATDTMGRSQRSREEGNLLDIIGARLLANPSAEIEVSGEVARRENIGLGTERVESLRDYLFDVWGVDRTRINASSRSIRRSSRETTSPTLMIRSSDPTILAPLEQTRITREIDPPKVGLTPEINAEAGLRSWEVLLRYGGREVGRVSGSIDGHNRPNSDDSTTEKKVGWQIASSRDLDTLLPLRAELNVEDSLGTRTTRHAEIPLQVERLVRRVERRADHRRVKETITFTLYDIDLSEEKNRTILVEIVGITGNRAMITIITSSNPGGGERGKEIVATLHSLLEKHGKRGVRVRLRTGSTPRDGGEIMVSQRLVEDERDWR